MVKKRIVSVLLCASMLLSYGINASAYNGADVAVKEDNVYDTGIASETDAGEDANGNVDSDEQISEVQSLDGQLADNQSQDGQNDAFEIPDDYHGHREIEIDLGDEEDCDSNEISLLQASSYPSRYDSRDYNCLTSIKNQNQWGSCWAFATLGAGESSMLKQGYASLSDEPNYSEYQLAYFFYHEKQDPLHNIDNDRNTIKTGENFLDFGGNITLASLALAGWVGAVDEKETGYPSSYEMDDLSNDLAFNGDIAHLQNAYMVSSAKDYSGKIKQLIMDYGAVASGFYFDTANCAMSENGDVIYNYQGNSVANHAIMIVGWDDNYPKENFRYPASSPSSNGAWLVRNSWGNTYPYIWVSYEDIRLSAHSAVACVFEPADNYDYNYQYDGTYGIDYIRFANPVIANVYTAAGADVESIEAVSFALNSSNVNYSIQIYVNPTDTTDPTSGVPMLATPQTGVTDYIGYKTVKLDNPVKVNRGDKFAIVISLSHSSGYVNVFADMDGYTFNGQLLFDSSASRGQSFFKENSDTFCDCLDFVDDAGDNVEDLCIRIKAFTKEASSGSAVDSTVDLSNVSVSSISDVYYNGTAITPEPTLTYRGNTLKKGVDYTLTYTNNLNVGTATVKILGRNNYKGSRTITFKIKQLNMSSTSITYTTSYKFTGGNIAPLPTVKYSGKTLIAGTDYTVSYSNNRNIGTATMTITGKGNCTGSRSLNFTIKGADSYETVYNGVDYSAVYDFNYYISRYEDLWNAFGWNTGAALEHFVLCGMSEGRQAKANFDVRSYKNAYPDLRKAFGSDLVQYYHHYIYYGKNEGRVATGVSVMQGGTTIYDGVDYGAVYDYNYYLTNNPDVKAAFGGNEDATIAHFVICGMNEGRRAKSSFDVWSYKNANPDLRRAFGNNIFLYYIHYMQFGMNEGRTATGVSSLQGGNTIYDGIDYSAVYDYNYYLAHNPDVKDAFNGDEDATLEHFVLCGMSEGRQAKADFNVYSYKNRYNDLSKTFGNTLKLYYLHYVYFGVSEGRNAK